MTVLEYANPIAVSRTPQWRTWLAKLGPLAGLALVYLFFVIVGPSGFSDRENAVLIARQTAIVGTGALGMTIIIIAGGIDLSAGSTIARTSVIIAWLTILSGHKQFDDTVGYSRFIPGEFAQHHPYVQPLLCALGGIAVGTLCGLVNGALIASLRIVPFIITLGTLLIFRGTATELAHEQKIDAPLTWLNDLLGGMLNQRGWILLDPGVWIMLILALAVSGMLRFTRLGRHIYAIGSNELTARLCGISVPRTKIIVYALGGFFMGVAGLMQFSRLSVGDPTVADGKELDIIAAVVIGGGSLSGGEGSVLGTLVGALIMTTISVGGSQMGWPAPRQKIITGVIIIIAVALDRLRHRRSQ